MCTEQLTGTSFSLLRGEFSATDLKINTAALREVLPPLPFTIIEARLSRYVLDGFHSTGGNIDAFCGSLRVSLNVAKLTKERVKISLGVMTLELGEPKSEELAQQLTELKISKLSSSRELIILFFIRIQVKIW